MNAAVEIARLRHVYPEVEEWVEGGQVMAYLPRVTVRRGGSPITIAALLCPHERGGYSSRLYVDRTLDGPNARNWTSCTVCGASWWACSWNGVPSTLPWLEMLSNHLRAFQ